MPVNNAIRATTQTSSGTIIRGSARIATNGNCDLEPPTYNTNDTGVAYQISDPDQLQITQRGNKSTVARTKSRWKFESFLTSGTWSKTTTISRDAVNALYNKEGRNWDLEACLWDSLVLAEIIGFQACPFPRFPCWLCKSNRCRTQRARTRMNLTLPVEVYSLRFCTISSRNSYRCVCIAIKLAVVIGLTPPNIWEWVDTCHS